jgi:cytosine/adenosine deaminase-related metal-dependent hydrolase
VAMATTHPNRLLSRPPGTLRPGDSADLVLFDLSGGDSPRLEVRATLLAGELVYGHLVV